MTDFIAVLVAIVAIVFIMKIAAKILKFVLTIAVIGLVIYLLSNFGFLKDSLCVFF